MCLLVFAWDCHPQYRFIFAGNRDEFHDRPARPAHWWDDRNLLAGRDEQAGGTWLGMRSDGRFAVVTNFREMIPRHEDLRSRGTLITDYMAADSGQDRTLVDQSDQYAGYNLILGDLSDGQLQYQSNRGQSRSIGPGLHGLSNHHLDTPWPKVTRAVSGLQKLCTQSAIDPQSLAELLANRQTAADNQLPDTGIGPRRERLLSSAFIVSPTYGTRCTTVILVDRNGIVHFLEKRFDLDGNTTGEDVFEFQVSTLHR